MTKKYVVTYTIEMPDDLEDTQAGSLFERICGSMEATFEEDLFEELINEGWEGESFEFVQDMRVVLP